MFAAAELIAVMAELRSNILQSGINTLRRDSTQHRAEPHWRAGRRTITSLDQTAWATLVGLIAECPVMHGANAFTFFRRVANRSGP
jgi:hypothetical protein